MLFTNEGKCYLNDLCFSDSEYLESFQSIAINIKDLTDDPAFLKPEIMFFKYESIEDIKSEFLQSTDQITSYYRNITLDFSGIDKDVATMEINIKHVSTGNNYSFRKKRAQKDQMLNLMLITKNENEPIFTAENYDEAIPFKVWYEKDQDIKPAQYKLKYTCKGKVAKTLKRETIITDWITLDFDSGDVNLQIPEGTEKQNATINSIRKKFMEEEE